MVPGSGVWWAEEGLFRAIFEHAPTAIAIADPDGRFRRCNPAYCTLLGWSEDELRDRDFSELVHPEDRAANLALVAEVVAGERQFVEVENRSVRRDGTDVWVHKFLTAIRGPDGGVSHLVALVTDISERQRLHAVLEESEERFRSMFEHAAVGVAHVDVEGRFVRVNPAYARITGRSPDELERMHFRDITHPDDLDDDLAQMHRLLAGELDHYALPKRYLRPDGEVVWVNLTGSVVRDGAGRPRYFIAVAEDITRELQRILEDQAAQLRARLLADLTVALDAAGSEVEQAEAIVGVLVPRFADYATVEVPDDGRPVLAAAHAEAEMLPVLVELRHHHRLRPSDPGSVARAARGEPLLLAEITDEDRAGYPMSERGHELLGRLRPRSHISVPIDLGGGRRGAVMAGRSAPGRPLFEAADRETVERLADRAGVRLVDTWLRVEEHWISLRLQQALLPDRLAAAPGLRLAARYRAATDLLEVGGDWYDSVELADGSVLVVVGDVVGHGLDAAAVMGRLRSGLAALAWRDADPGRLLVELDRFARAQGAGYATVGCALVDPVTGSVRYSLAGHLPFLVVGADGSTRWLDEALAVPLCTIPVAERPVASTRLEPGSTMVLVTDGLVERRGEPLDRGLDRLASVAVRLRDAEDESLADRLLGEMVGVGSGADDVVVVTLRHDPAPTLRCSIPSDPVALAGLRAEVRAWLVEQAIPGRMGTDLLLALGEAASNAVEHAYDSGAGMVDVVLRRDGDDVFVRVRDHGRWRPPPTWTDRGRGTGIMSAVSSCFDRRTDEEGTVVELVVPSGGDGG